MAAGGPREGPDPAAADFRYEEVGAGVFSTRSGWRSFVIGATLHSVILLWPVLDILLTPIPPIQVACPTAPLIAPPRIPLPRVIRLVRVEPDAGKPESQTPKEQQEKFTAPTKINLLAAEGGARARFKGRIDFTFVLDREQNLPKVLSRQNGSLGFGQAEVVRRQFRGPNWTPVSLPREGVALNGFYYLLIDESTGLYAFVEEMRLRDATLRLLQPYALFGFEFQAQVEEAIASAASGTCAPGDNLRAVVRLDPVADVRIEEIQCLKK
jgi:hypothetical protein